MNIIGMTTINPFFFYTGKIAGYGTWILLVLSFFNVIEISMYASPVLTYGSCAAFALGVALTVFSSINLGKSTRLGLPGEDTVLKTGGIYRISRNPMYVGFNLFTIASMLYTSNIFVVIAGLYSIVIYHFIIIGEEKFLSDRFGIAYGEYTKRVRRYL
jgi:protein-S-isoprenylcysteine O-methyltransferase Ste14